MMAPRPHVLREYALLADGYRGVLVGPEGDFAWMCAPRWDSPAVFSSLAGSDCSYAITPRGRFVWGGFYEDGSLIWRSRWVTEGGGIVECREALALPSDAHRAVLLRRVHAVRGPAELEVALSPGAAFGTHDLTDLRRDDDGRWHGRTGDLQMRWSGGGDARPDDGDESCLRMVLRLEPGTEHDLVLELSDAALERPVPDPERMWTSTAAAWREQLPRFSTSIAERDARHAYAVLHGLTHASGGMVAAATAGLPERADRGRNYDYRFVWIRDQCFAGQAVAAAGPHPLLDDAVRFVSERLLQDGPDLAPAYTVDGKQVPAEHDSGLPGYPGGSGMLGNHVRAQFQLDAFGEALLLFAAAARHDRLDTDHWRAATLAVAAIEQRWSDAGAGLWELHPGRWTHSRLIGAAGLRQLAATAAPTGDAARLERPRRPHRRRHLLGLHPSGRWQRAVDDERVDAALLLPPVRGAVPADDPRTVATLDAVRNGADRRRVRLPVPPRQPPLGVCRRRVPALRVHDGARRAPTGQRDRGRPLVRTQPGRLRATGPLRRGVRRRPTPAARQPPAGLRARDAARNLDPARYARPGSRAVNVAGALTLVRAANGVLLLAAPGPTLHATVHGRDDRAARMVTRTLGARHLVQAGLTGLRPGPTALWVGATVDALHAATALGLAALDADRRRAALGNALSALLFAAAAAALARGGGWHDPDTPR